MIDEFNKEIFDLPNSDYKIDIRRYTIEPNSSAVLTHWHDQMEILLIMDGNLNIICDGVYIKASKDDAVIINSKQLHSAYSAETVSDYYCIIFDFELLRSCYNDRCENNFIIPLIKGNIVIDNFINNNEALKIIYKMVDEYNNSEQNNELIIKGYVITVLGLLIQKLSCIQNQKYNVLESNYFYKILSYIQEEYNKKITAKSLAETFGFNESYLCRKFKRTTGLTITQYINELRLSKSQYLLLNTNMSITEIASLVGIDDSNYFTRLYKKHYNKSPFMFRK